ncbi:MAG: aconitate hydratase [Actinobacteria bacterium]|nr:aconitate hydratase [Actinomycetota bacterium]
MPTIDSTPEFAAAVYQRLRARLAIVQGRLNRALTLTEKLVYGHLDDPAGQDLRAGTSYLLLRPDRVAMQDATAQMALLQFMLAGRPTVGVPATVHCDHLIRAYAGASSDLQTALLENDEVYNFLRSVSAKYGIGFWAPGSGIIHQVILENYAFPGGLMIGTDSHTPNAGGLGMLAIGVGGADAVDVMVDFPWELLHPRLIGVRLAGTLQGWTAPKDVILKLAGILTTEGGTNRVIEYFGPGARTLACTGKATVTNMGAELGATTSIFPYDARMAAYLRGTARAALADLADRHADLLTADAEVEAHPERFFERVVEIDLAALEPHVVGPHRPDLARPVSAVAAAVATENYPDRLSATLVGSCTNSSYEDISRAADVARQASAHGAKVAVPFLVTPGSEMVRATIARDGQLGDLEAIGATVLANACGPCIGQWRREDIKPDTPGDAPKRNAIVTSFNRNFPRRNDGSPNTLAFITSPELAVAYGLAGRLTFNPLTDALSAPDGTTFKLQAPRTAPDIPAGGFIGRRHGCLAPSAEGTDVTVAIAPDSQRLQALAPFAPRRAAEFADMPVLLKAKGQCTTDAISPAGQWLRYRGHLDKISDNMFIGATNAFSDEPGTGHNQITGDEGEALAAIARTYKAQQRLWVAVGDQNYGEGSSREHAAMSPRHLGAGAIIVRSFARIHESNLKKQGLLPLTFTDPSDYDHIWADDRIDLADLDHLAPGRPLTATVRHRDGTAHTIKLTHTLNSEQISWFHAGSALNVIRARAAVPPARQDAGDHPS